MWQCLKTRIFIFLRSYGSWIYNYLCNQCLSLLKLWVYVPFVLNTSQSFPRSWLIIGFVTRLTRRVPLVEQEQLTLHEHLGSHPDFSEARVTRSLVLCVCFVGRCSSLCTFSFGHCVVCPSSICGFLFSLWYLQTLFFIPFMLRCTRYNIMWSSLSVTGDKSVNFSGYSDFLHQS